MLHQSDTQGHFGEDINETHRTDFVMAVQILLSSIISGIYEPGRLKILKGQSALHTKVKSLERRPHRFMIVFRCVLNPISRGLQRNKSSLEDQTLRIFNAFKISRSIH